MEAKPATDKTLTQDFSLTLSKQFNTSKEAHPLKAYDHVLSFETSVTKDWVNRQDFTLNDPILMVIHSLLNEKNYALTTS